MATSLKSQSNYPSIRSISLPCRSHPNTARIEVELNKFKSWHSSSSLSFAPTTKKITISLSRLMDLYNCMEDLLSLPITQQALSHHRCESFVDDLQDGLMILLDICGSVRELVSQMRENGRDIQSCIRRKNGDSNLESIVAKYIRFRKRMNKDAKKLIVALKVQMENKIGTTPLLGDLDRHVSSVIRALREVVAVSVSVLQSLLFFASVPVAKPKSTTWTMVSKFLQKGAAACDQNQIEANNLNHELQILDIALDAIIYRSSESESSRGEKMGVAQNRLESLEMSIEGIENGVEGLYRGLIKAKASLLNIGSSILC